MSDETPTSHSFELAVPASPQSVAVSRLFAGAVARHFSVDEDMIGDLKVAVSEAVTNSIGSRKRTGGADTPVRVRILCGNGSCSVEIADPAGDFGTYVDAAGARTPPAGLYEGSLGLSLIRSLFPDAEIAAGEPGGTVVRFTARF